MSAAVRGAVNFAILKAHRLGEPRLLELPRSHLSALRQAAEADDWNGQAPFTYRGLRVAVTTAACGRVLAWDRAREVQMSQAIDLPTQP